MSPIASPALQDVDAGESAWFFFTVSDSLYSFDEVLLLFKPTLLRSFDQIYRHREEGDRYDNWLICCGR